MFLSFILALIPIAWLFLALAGLRMPAWKAGAIGLVITAALAVTRWHMPGTQAVSAAFEGWLTAVWPICGIIIAVLFTYNLTVESGAMAVLEKLLTSLSDDPRILALLIVWGFGNFIEGVAGFSTSVAIPSAMLVAVGMEPVPAVVAALVANAMPTPYGCVGIGTTMAALVTGTSGADLAQATAILEALLTLATPFVLVVIAGSSLRALNGLWGLTAAASLAFTLPAGFFALTSGETLPDIMGSICCMAVVAGLARRRHEGPKRPVPVSPRQALEAASTYVFILVFLILTSRLVPPVYNALARVKSTAVVYTGPDALTLDFNWLTSPALWLALAGLLGAIPARLSPRCMVGVLTDTLRRYWTTLATVMTILACARVMTYSGMIADIAVFLAAALGTAYPLAAPVVGALGGFVTGGSTATSLLFAPLQHQTALAVGLTQEWLIAANTMGAGVGKIVCLKSLTIGCAAAGINGQEGVCMREALPYAAVYLGISCLSAYVCTLVWG